MLKSWCRFTSHRKITAKQLEPFQVKYLRYSRIKYIAYAQVSSCIGDGKNKTFLCYKIIY